MNTVNGTSREWRRQVNHSLVELSGAVQTLSRAAADARGRLDALDARVGALEAVRARGVASRARAKAAAQAKRTGAGR